MQSMCYTYHAKTRQYVQVLMQHARQTTIRSMQNMQTLQRHVDSGADEPVQFAGGAQEHCLASFKRYMLADLQATYMAIVQRKARKALSAPRMHHACINTRDLLSEHCMWHRQSPDMHTKPTPFRIATKFAIQIHVAIDTTIATPSCN